MKCRREGCGNEVTPPRRKYCSVRCSNRVNVAMSRRRSAEKIRAFREEPEPTSVAVRTCLGCDRPFRSEGPWNRICGRCGVNRHLSPEESIGYEVRRRGRLVQDRALKGLLG